MSVLGGKDKYLCLLAYIRKENPKLYEVISDLCIDGIFRSQRYKNTFLMPNEKLTNKIHQMVEKDEDDKAVDKIRSLLLKECLTSKKDFTGEIVNMNAKEVNDPVGLYGDLTELKKKIMTDYGEVVTVVYAYKGDDVPAAGKENKKKSSMVPRRGGKNGGNTQSNRDHEKIEKLTKKLISNNNAEATFKNFKDAVSKLLVILEKKGKLEEAKYYLSPHPVLSWYFLTLPYCNHSLLSNNDMEDYEKMIAVNDEPYKKALHEANVSSSFFNKINGMRRELLQEECTKNKLSSAIVAKYKQSFSEKLFPAEIISSFGDNVNLKILQDELRFLFEDCTSEESMEHLLEHLDRINWSTPEKHFIIADQGIYCNLIKPNECFVSGPVSFVKSIYFLYTALSDDVENKLMKSKKGGSDITGGNPMSQTSVIYRGSGTRQMLGGYMCGSGDDSSIDHIYDSLSESQKALLKEKLCK